MVVVDGEEKFLQGPSVEEKATLRAAWIQTIDAQVPVAVRTFAVSQTEVTLGEFEAFLSSTGYRPTKGLGCTAFAESFPYVTFMPRANLSFDDPGFEQAENSPITCVTIVDATQYAQWLSDRTGQRYRLPREAEWELLARASLADIGTPNEAASRLCEYENIADENATRSFDMQTRWKCDDGYGDRTAPVGSYLPNRLGVFDVIGNVAEYVGDCADDYELPPDQARQWSLDSTCEAYVIKGASFLDGYPAAYPSARVVSVGDHRIVALGFRVVREMVGLNEAQ